MKSLYREFLCLHNPKGYNGVCNDEGGNYCPDGGCERACLAFLEVMNGRE